MFLALLLGAACLGLCNPPAAHAAMQLDRTRLVVLETDGSAMVQAHSEDALPLLLQAWIDAGGDDGAIQTQAAPPASPPTTPFITDPPVMRLNPGGSRALRVLLVDAAETLPADRESLYWLNVLEVPARVADAAGSRLHFSVQSRLKLFYRPKALARYGHDALPAAERLRFALEEDAAGQHWLAIDNPAPIHQTLAALALHQSDGRVITLATPMLAPFGRARVALPAAPWAESAAVPTRAPTPARLHFATLGDDGNLIEDSQTLQHPLL